MSALKYLLTRLSTPAALMSLLLAGSLTATTALADPPSRVGRVSYIEGSVSFYADRTEGWTRARINYPVTSQNSIWTEGAARAEVRIGASALRLGDDTIVDFVRVLDDQTDAYLQRGTLNVRTRNYGGDTYRNGFSIETTEGRFTIEGNGRYRLEAAQGGGESRLTVFGGRGRFEGNDNNVLTVDAGKSLVVQNTRPTVTFRFESVRESDFDRWAQARDANWDATHTRYVRERVISPYMTGYEELDSHGDWIDDREYGRIWAPRYVSAGWAPYRYGSWTYVSPWGWTWVDDAPWGFAPFHYGRWVTVGSRWCWWPGRYHHRPVYAPALVAWYGSPGATLSVTVSNSRPVGWFPLAPHEHYVPRYTNNITYIRNVNYVTNNVTVINPPARYAHTHAATFVQPAALVHSKPVASNLVRTDRAALAEYVAQASINLPPPVRNAPAVAGGRSVAPVYVAPGEQRMITKPAMMAPAPGAALQPQPQQPPQPAVTGAPPMPAPIASVAPTQPGAAKPMVMPPAAVARPAPMQSGAPLTAAPPPLPAPQPSTPPAPQPAPVQAAVAKPMPMPLPLPVPVQPPAPTYTQKPGSGLNHPPGPPPNPVTPPPNPVTPVPSIPPAIAGAPHRAPVAPPHMQPQPQVEPAPQPRQHHPRQPRVERVEPQRIEPRAEPARSMPQAVAPAAVAPAAAHIAREVKPQHVDKPRHEGNRDKPNEGRTKPGVVLQ